jgi:two-component system chemotaxis response regulator CheY
MIVDDEEFLHDLYVKILDLKGHRVVATALNGEEAVAMFKDMSVKPDVILMDHRMPVKNGLEAMRDILALDAKAQVIFLTADYSVAKQAMNEGAVGFISKPFQMDILHGAVEDIEHRLEALGNVN